MLNNFKNFISLGYFCEVAGELEKYGFRSASYPFDWMISDFSGIIKCIEEEFKDFLNINYLSQSAIERSHYKNEKYNFYFFHDFDKYKSLEKQLPAIVAKYKRRSERFLKNIKSPTLFVRYISDEIKNESGKSIELLWIEQHVSEIEQCLKNFNNDNEILFIANEGVTSDILTIYNIMPDENDRVARKWISKNEYLQKYFSSFEYSEKERNIQRYKKKDKKRKNFFRRAYKKIIRLSKKKFLKEYIYERNYDIPDK